MLKCPERFCLFEDSNVAFRLPESSQLNTAAENKPLLVGKAVGAFDLRNPG